MSAYMEHTLIPGKAQQAPAASPIYELIGNTNIIIVITIVTMNALCHAFMNIMIIFSLIIGVTVHTGNADGGHYYAFARFHLHHHPHPTSSTT